MLQKGCGRCHKKTDNLIYLKVELFDGEGNKFESSMSNCLECATEVHNFLTRGNLIASLSTIEKILNKNKEKPKQLDDSKN